MFPLRSLFRAVPCGGYPQTPSQALPATVSSYPTLSYRKRGLRTTPQAPRQSLARDLIDSGQKPPYVKVFLYGSQSLCPFGASHGLLHPRFRRPLERGSMSGVTKRCNGIKRKGTQSPFSQRRPAFSIVGVKIWRTPKGQRLESHTNARHPAGCRLLPTGRKNFDGESQLSESTKPPAKDWREVWRVVRSPFL